MTKICFILTVVWCALALCAVPASAGASKERPGMIKGESREPQACEADALQEARKDAGKILLGKVRNVAITNVKQQSRAGVTVPKDEIIQEVIAAELARDTLLIDKSTEKQKKSYADIYYATVLIDASPKQLDRMADRAIAIAQAGTKRTVSAAASGTALLAVIALIYFGANAVTRGYYQWRLRLLAAASCAAGIAAVTGLYFGFTGV